MIEGRSKKKKEHTRMMENFEGRVLKLEHGDSLKKTYLTME